MRNAWKAGAARPLSRLAYIPVPSHSPPSGHDLRPPPSRPVSLALTFHTSPMPTPTLQTRGVFSHSRSTDNLRAHRSGSSTPTSPWKSMFRIGSQSSRKLTPNGTASSLTLDTNFSSPSPPTPNFILTPASLIPPSQRDSSNSSNISTDSNNEKVPATPPDNAAPSVLVSPSPDASFDAKHRSRPKPGRPRLMGRERCGPPATTTATVPSSYFPDPSPPSGPRPRSSRSMGATASRLLRRVASAPNAKGLFHLSSRQSSVVTKNGLLAPAVMASAVVPKGGTPTSHPTSGDGTSSIETVSSASSSNRAPRAISTPALAKVSENESSLHGANKAAFRRTYSSNSIKVKSVSVSVCLFLLMTRLSFFNFHQG
jgi:protein-serine/threonine kinase